MNYTHYVLLIFSFISTAASGDQQRATIKFDTMPESVRDTVSHFLDRDKITTIEQVSEGRHVKFEIKSHKTVDNKDFVDIDMTVASDGEIMKLIKEVPMFKIPFHVMEQVNRRYPDLKIDEVELVQSRHFLLQGKTAGQPVRLKIYDDGRVEEMPAVPNSPQQTQQTQQAQQSTPQKAVEVPADSYQRNWSDDDAGLQDERNDANVDSYPDDE